MVKLFVVFWLCVPALGFAKQTLNIAVTASFKPVLEKLVEPFEQRSGIHLALSSASTGILYQQILAGAPFDVFFAADEQRPQAIVEALSLDPSQAKNYVTGQLVLVVQNHAIESLQDLSNYKGRVILANPKHAPYGIAAASVLDQLDYQGQRVLANNVSQARQYLSLGLGEVGLVAASVALDFQEVTVVDSSLYKPIHQQLVVLVPSQATRALLAFLNTDEVSELIRQQGYEIPGSL